MEAKKIIITGGATRIGAAIAKSLATYDTKISIHFNKSKSNALKLKKKVDLENICNGVKFLIENKNITGEIINIDSGQRMAWQTPDIINTKE